MILEEVIIDYALLSKAITYYKSKGYCPIEVPWVVTHAASMETAPMESVVYVTNYKEHFIGSAEQGFIQLMLEQPHKLILERKYFAVSPCFRRDTPDDIHSRWFVKLELFQMFRDKEPAVYVKAMHDIIADAKEFLTSLVTTGVPIEEEYDSKKLIVDLMYDNLELGSYGYKHLKQANATWIFGTGLALPRTQLIMNQY